MNRARAGAHAGAVRMSMMTGLVVAWGGACGGPWGLACGAEGASASGQPPRYAMQELEHIISESLSLPLAISDAVADVGAVVVGQSFSSFSPPTLSWRAVAWRPALGAAPLDLLTIAQAGDSTVNIAHDVSPSGQYIVGASNTAPPHGVRWTFDPARGAVTSIDTLAALPGDGASAGVGVNSAGRVAGYSLTDSSTTRGVTWAPGSVQPTLLPAPPGSGGLRLAREISEPPLEHIVGRCDMSSTPTTRPILWRHSGGTYGVGQLLPHLDSMLVHDAVGISPDGALAVGLGATASQARGVAWDTRSSAVIDFGGLCCSHNVVHDVNNAGIGVGYHAIALEVFRATIFIDGVAHDLNGRVANNPEVGTNLFLHVATAINAQGQIVGTFGGFTSGEPLSPGRVFLLTPLPPGDVTGDGVVDINDLLAVIAAWGDCPAPPAACAADITGDGVVGIDDLLAVVGNWG